MSSNALKNKMILFVLLVSVCSIVAIILSNQLWFQPYSRSILNAYAHLSSLILNILGQSTSVVDANITSSNFSIQVKKGCDAIAPMLLYIFSIIFYPANWKSKLKGLAVGLPILAILNLVRIISLFLIGKYGNQMIFDIFHVDIWQVIFIVFSLIIWSYWLRHTQIQSIEVNEN